jgi:cell division protein ZapA
MENKIKVKIYGNEYTIIGDAQPEYIQKLAEYIDTRMNEIGKSITNGNITQIAILAALNIADEYYQLNDIKGDITGEMERKTNSLISMLDKGLIGDIFTGIEAVPNQNGC